MPGLGNILIGFGIAFVGTVITFATYSAASGGGTYVVAYGAIIVGGLQFVMGLFQLLFYALRGSKGREQHHADVGVRVIVRSMIAMAAADGELEPGEVTMIQMITQSMFGTPLSEDDISKAYEEFPAGGFGVLEEIGRVSGQLKPEFARLALKSMSMVAMSDGQLDEKEEQLLMAVGQKLGIGADEIQHQFDEANQTIAEIIRASDASEPAEPS